MSDKETDYLNKLFSSELNDADAEVPMLEVPSTLSDKLRAIPETSLHQSEPIKHRIAKVWPKFTGIAASLLVAVVVFQLYQQQQTLKQLEQAQADLAIALQYLGEANEIARAQVLATLNSNMQKASVRPVIEISREAVLPNLKPIDNKTDTERRSL